MPHFAPSCHALTSMAVKCARDKIHSTIHNLLIVSLQQRQWCRRSRSPVHATSLTAALSVQKPILMEDYSNLYNVNGKALSSGGVG